MDKTFNLIINGVGGQGVITLLWLIDKAAFAQGYDVRSSELHGLSQRGGSVEVHLRLGKKINSPLITNGKADLIISLEMMEGLRSISKAGKQTKFLVNEYALPFQGSLSLQEIRAKLDSLGGRLRIVPASFVCKEKLQNEIVSTVYLLGYAVANNLIPIKKESVLEVIKEMPEKYRDLNKNAFNLGFSNGK